MIQVKEGWFYSKPCIPFTQVNFCWSGFSNSHPAHVTDEGKLGHKSS